MIDMWLGNSIRSSNWLPKKTPAFTILFSASFCDGRQACGQSAGLFWDYVHIPWIC